MRKLATIQRIAEVKTIENAFTTKGNTKKSIK